jgi:hypothetical protein
MLIRCVIIFYLFSGVESPYKYLLLCFLFRHYVDKYVQILDRQILCVLREIWLGMS